MDKKIKATVARKGAEPKTVMLDSGYLRKRVWLPGDPRAWRIVKLEWRR